MKLRGGRETLDPRLDRVPQFDVRSREFPIRPMVEDKPLRSYTWRCEARLDQGQEGACVGFAWSHDLAARPAVVPVTEEFAREKIYREAQRIDEWAGESYEGTSVLAGAKIVKALGFIKEYRWAFGLQDVLLTLGYAGPVVVGVPWFEKMMETDEQGFIRAEGQLMGHHAILIKQVSFMRNAVKPHNSWGAGWGVGGDCWLSISDLDKLLKQEGEACVPLGRRRINAR
jgi:hypothetical protein